MTDWESHRDAMLSLMCAFCTAQPGQWCTTRYGSRASALHADRWYDAVDRGLIETGVM